MKDMKGIIKKIKGVVMGRLGRLRYDRLLHFVAGVLVGAFVAIVFPSVAPLAMFVAGGVGLLKEVVDMWIGDGLDAYDFFATLIGGIVIELFVIL